MTPDTTIGPAASAARTACARSRTMGRRGAVRVTVAAIVAVLSLLLAGPGARAATMTSFSGDGDAQALYQSPSCQSGQSAQPLPCTMVSVGRGTAQLAQTPFAFRYVLVQTIDLGQGAPSDLGFCAPTTAQLALAGDPAQGMSVLTLSVQGQACWGQGTWTFAGSYVAVGVSGVFRGATGSGTVTGMVVGDAPGGGCIMWSGALILAGQ